jgi:hypothetical protein
MVSVPIPQETTKLYAYTLGYTATIYFGMISVQLNKDSRHFEESLWLGNCALGFKNSEILRLFNKYNVTIVNNQNCPEIIAFAKLWTFGDDENEKDNLYV